MANNKITTAYHFTADKLRDGSPLPKKGKWLKYEGEIKICGSGLHFSRHPFDALEYAPGNLLHLVEVRGIEDEHDDKGVARERRIVATIDAESLLREFARKCALDVVHLWDAPEVVVKYLKTGDESLRAAAWAAARDAAWAAASDAARDMAAAAASDAARARAAAAAWVVAWAAARDMARARAADAAGAAAAARDAAWEKQRTRFKRMVTKAFKEGKDEQ